MLKVDITKTLSDFSLKVAFEIDRQILVLFGSSGAGKSLTLECIAGLVRPEKGIIRLDDKIFYQSPSQYVPIHKRGIGVVFQGYALFPHLTVAQNLAYGIRYAKGPTIRVKDGYAGASTASGSGGSISKSTFWRTTAKSCAGKSPSYSAQIAAT